MKSISKSASNDVWSASLNRKAHPVLKKEFGSNTSWKPDSYKINADRIRNKEPVGENWLWGRGAASLVHFGYLTEAELEPHRQAYLDAITMYGDSQKLHDDLVKRYKDAMDILKN